MDAMDWKVARCAALKANREGSEKQAASIVLGPCL